jgi:hypothetical protein
MISSDAKCPSVPRPALSAPTLPAPGPPQIYGMFVVKLAMALMVVGGVPRCDEAGTHIRGEIHMLLVGDPGTGGWHFGGGGRRAAMQDVFCRAKC